MKITFKRVYSSLKICLLTPPALVTRLWNPDVWTITERHNQARDNGYIFFRYMREQHPEKKVYYIIDRDADDLKKIEKYGNIIFSNSWRHYFYYVLSKVHISSHTGFGCPDGAVVSRWLKKPLHLFNVLLPHGVSYGVADFVLGKYGFIDLFICSGKLEYDNVLENYGYTAEQVAYTGFPRLDEWHNIQVKNNQIVLMPTWRMYLVRDPNLVFEDSAYFKAYQNLINNRELQQFLETNQLKLVFYLHHEMQKYAGSFSSDCTCIEIVERDDQYDIQELLKESALLITDYSSVHFDFAYMNKPVIYYQFDKEDFYGKQYQKGLFEVERDGFGPVIDKEEDLVRTIKSFYERKFKMSERYYQRMRAFYQLHDEHNCERVYETICKKMELKGIHESFPHC